MDCFIAVGNIHYWMPPAQIPAGVIHAPFGKQAVLRIDHVADREDGKVHARLDGAVVQKPTVRAGFQEGAAPGKHRFAVRSERSCYSQDRRSIRYAKAGRRQGIHLLHKQGSPSANHNRPTFAVRK
jgi:hypothetical protein